MKNNNPKSDLPSKEDGIEVGTVNLAPRLSSAQYMNIVDANLETMRKEFGPCWTKVKKYGDTISNPALEIMTKSRRTFIMRWFDLLIADLEIIDCVAANNGFYRGHVPGVITKFAFDGRHVTPVVPSFEILIRGRPLHINPLADARQEALNLVEAGKASTLKYEMECYFRGKGYEVLEIKDEMGVSL
jgi:hypothetical protein